MVVTGAVWSIVVVVCEVSLLAFGFLVERVFLTGDLLKFT